MRKKSEQSDEERAALTERNEIKKHFAEMRDQLKATGDRADAALEKLRERSKRGAKRHLRALP
jgi:hypothetical protein